jgi:predicted Zn-dependent protease
MCLESLPGMQDRLRAAVEAGYAPEIVTAAHALRGLILNVHARPSVEALAILEPLLREQPRSPWLHELKGQFLFEGGRPAGSAARVRLHGQRGETRADDGV